MTRSPFTRLVFLSVLLMHLVVGVSQVQGSVWCFDFGGGVRLEVLPEGCCDPAVPCDGAEHAEGAEHADGAGLRTIAPEACEGCLDLPAHSSSVWHSPRLSPDTEAVAPAFIAALPAPVFSIFLLRAGAAGFQPQPPPPDHPPLAILRTIVLRN